MVPSFDRPYQACVTVLFGQCGDLLRCGFSARAGPCRLQRPYRWPDTETVEYVGNRLEPEGANTAEVNSLGGDWGAGSGLDSALADLRRRLSVNVNNAVSVVWTFSIFPSIPSILAASSCRVSPLGAAVDMIGLCRPRRFWKAGDPPL